MNEQFEKLAKQSYEYADNLGLSGDEWCDAQMKKFAELIIQDCLLAISKTPMNDDEIPTMVKCHDYVEKHFGVEYVE